MTSLARFSQWNLYHVRVVYDGLRYGNDRSSNGSPLEPASSHQRFGIDIDVGLQCLSDYYTLDKNGRH